MANSFTKALQGAVDKVTGTTRIDNSTDPTSALSMLKRKAASKVAPTKVQAAGFKPQ